MKKVLCFLAALCCVVPHLYAAPAQIGSPSMDAPVVNSLTHKNCLGFMYGHSANPVDCATSIPTTALSGVITGAQLATGAAAANLGFTPLRPANNLSDLASAATARANLGLGSAATQPSTAFDAAGAAASVAGSLKPVATSGSYADLTDKPALGTASSHAAGDFETAGAAAAAQTAAQAASLQKAANLSDVANAAAARGALGAAASGVNGDIRELQGLSTPLSQAQGGTGSPLGPQAVPFVATGVTAAVDAKTRAGWRLTPQDFNAQAGSGGDDSTAINAAITATVANPSKSGQVFFPTPSSGYYNVCASSVVIPNTGADYALRLTGASRGVAIRILPNCATPPDAVISMGASWSSDSAMTTQIENLRIDGWCLAKNLHIIQASYFNAQNVVFRNAKKGGANVKIDAGFVDFSQSVVTENVNDWGHACYSAKSELPDYNIDTAGSDSNFQNVTAVDARVANFNQSAGGNNHFAGAHGWGYRTDPVLGVNLAPDYNFQLAGDVDLTGGWVADSAEVAGVHVVYMPWVLGPTIKDGKIEGPPSTGGWLPPGVKGVLLDSGVKGAYVEGLYINIANPADGVVQDGTADASTVVCYNQGASYVANCGKLPVSYAAPLTFSGGVLGFSWPVNLPVSSVAPPGGLAGVSSIPGVASYINLASMPPATVSAPPAGGVQATIAVTTLHAWHSGAVVAGGSGYAVDDVVQLSGGTVADGCAPLRYKVTSVSAGTITGITWFGSQNPCYSMIPDDTTSVSWSTVSGSGSGLRTHGVLWTITSASDFTVTATGSGYLSAPTISVPQPNMGFVYTFPGALTSTLTLRGGGSGQVVLDAVGTKLGIAGVSGAPVISQGATVDGSGVRYALTTTGYTIPVNTSLVRFTQGSGIASATLTLPTAIDGQMLQFVNYAGAVAALTFSPAVNGWTNGSTLAAYSGLRVRWDATAAAWYREQ